MRLLVYPQINPKVTEKLISNDDIYCLCNNLRYLHECNLIACGIFFYRDHCVSCTAIDSSEKYQDNAVVVFADVTLNTGNAYSATTGEFTAHVKGHFFFTWTISTTQGALVSTQLVINGNSVGYNLINGRSNGQNYETSSSTVNVKMEENDVITRRLYETRVFAYKMLSSFSGFK